MSLDHIKLTEPIEPVDPKKSAERSRYNSVINATKIAQEICKVKGIEDLSNESISYSGNDFSGIFTFTSPCGFLIRITCYQYDSNEGSYEVEVYHQGQNMSETIRGYIGGISSGKTGNNITTYPLSRKDVFSEEEYRHYLDEPLKSINNFLEQQQGLEK